MNEEEETARVLDLLKEFLDDHELGECPCDLSDGGYGLCFAGQWEDGIIDNKEVIRTLGVPPREL